MAVRACLRASRHLHHVSALYLFVTLLQQINNHVAIIFTRYLYTGSSNEINF